jgi:hypothetical protein
VAVATWARVGGRPGRGVNRSGGGRACTDESGSFGYRRNVLCNWRRKGGRGIGVVSEKEVVMEVV